MYLYRCTTAHRHVQMSNMLEAGRRHPRRRRPNTVAPPNRTAHWHRLEDDDQQGHSSFLLSIASSSSCAWTNSWRHGSQPAGVGLGLDLPACVLVRIPLSLHASSSYAQCHRQGSSVLRNSMVRRENWFFGHLPGLSLRTYQKYVHQHIRHRATATAKTATTAQQPKAAKAGRETLSVQRGRVV